MKKLFALLLFLVPLFLFADSDPDWERQLDTIVDELMVIHEQLHPLFWSDEQLNPQVRESVLKWAQKQFKQLKRVIPGIQLVDVQFIGSMANYNYTSYSDLDFHLIVDLSKITYPKKLANFHLILLNQLWTKDYEKINLHFYHYPVQILAFTEQTEYRQEDTPIYSLLSNSWLNKPKHSKLTFSKETLIEAVKNQHMKFLHLSKTYENQPNKSNCSAIGNFYYALKKLRVDALHVNPEGQYSLENIQFKALRNLGDIEQMNLQYLTCQFMAMSDGEYSSPSEDRSF